MIDQLLELPWIISGTLLVGGFVLLSLLGVRFVRNAVTSKTLKASHDVAGFSFGIMGVIYAVLLGFIVVTVNNSFQDAQRDILEETSVLVELFRNASPFPKDTQTKVRTLLRDYAEEIYSREWELLARAEQSPEAFAIYQKIWEAYAAYVPKTEHEMAWYKESITKLNELSKQRTKRIFNSHLGLGGLMWTVLIFGAIATMSFMCFFYADSSWIHLTMTALLSGMIGFMLFLILSLGGIYGGDIKIYPEDLKRAVEQFNRVLDQSS